MSQLVLKHPDLKHEDLKFNTVEVHAGEPRDMYGALIPPITRRPHSILIPRTMR